MCVRMCGCHDPRVSRAVRPIRRAQYTKDFVLNFGIAPFRVDPGGVFGFEAQSDVLNISWCVQSQHASAKGDPGVKQRDRTLRKSKP